MLFILFDIEVIFLYPVAVHLKASGAFVLGEIARVRGAAGGRVRVRVAQGCARVEVKRERLVEPFDAEQPRTAEELRVRQLRARDLLRGDLEGADLDAVRRGARAHDHARQGAQLGALQRALARPPSASPAARSR